MTDPVMLLSQVHGEGRVTFRALRAAGFDTLEGVAGASLHVLSDRAHLSTQTARRLKLGAEEMLGRGIGAAFAADPPPGSRARVPRPGGRNGRAQTEPSFSEGVSLAEAALLGQGRDPEPALPPRRPEIAAAAELAASLIRSHTQPDAEARGETAATPGPRRPLTGRASGTFWSFG